MKSLTSRCTADKISANPLHIKTAVPTGVGTGHVYIVDGIVVDGVAEYVDLARDVGLTAS